MGKQPIQLDWFYLVSRTNIYQYYAWLVPLARSVERIADFGCWEGEEAFTLLWALDASQVTVIEKKEEHLGNLRKRLLQIRDKAPLSMEGRHIEVIEADMTKQVEQLQSGCFDLAFCKDVLYDIPIHGSLQDVQYAVSEMARVVKPGGYVIAVEGDVYAEYEGFEKDPIFAVQRPKPKGEPVDIHPMFAAAGLVRSELINAPQGAYIYRKAA